MCDPWSRSSAAIGAFSSGPIVACRPSALSSTLPVRRGVGAPDVQQRVLQRAQGRALGGLSRAGSLPTLQGGLRPHTSGPTVSQGPLEPGGPLVSQRTAPLVSAFAQRRRHSGCEGALARSADGRPYGAAAPSRGFAQPPWAKLKAPAPAGEPLRSGTLPPRFAPVGLGAASRRAATASPAVLNGRQRAPPAQPHQLPPSAPPNPPASSPARSGLTARYEVRAGATTIQGTHPGKAANQDRYLIELPPGPGGRAAAGGWSGSGASGPQPAGAAGGVPAVAVGGVFDGHGELGHHVSAFVADRLRAELLGTAGEAAGGALSAAALGRKLVGSFERTNRALGVSGIDVRHSGTTACTVQLVGDELIVANVGDSRAVLGRLEPQPGAPGRARAVGCDLSIDHKPDSEAELRRITRLGGKVAPMHVAGHGFVGPARVWDRSQRFGLATSRAFGDSTHSVASGGQVVAEPEVSVHKLREGDRYVVLCSDGVWDQLSSQQAVELAAAHGADARAGSEAIALEAKRRWELSGPVRDDITALVMHLTPANAEGGVADRARLAGGAESLAARLSTL